MKQIACLVIAACVAAPAWAAAARKPVPAARPGPKREAAGPPMKPLRVCADPDNLPFSNARGEGFENQIAAVLAVETAAVVTYVWRGEQLGFLNATLRKGACDLVFGVPRGSTPGLMTTIPYYRSSYMIVQRAGDAPVAGLDDPALRRLRLGVQIVGDDGVPTPPAQALLARGIVSNARAFPIYGVHDEPGGRAAIMRAVADGEIDAALVWGPLAGFYATRLATPLVLRAITPPSEAAAFDVAIGLRPGEAALADELSGALARRRPAIDAILAAFGVPRRDRPQAAGVRPPDGRGG